MDDLTRSFNNALALALAEGSEEPLRPQDLAEKSRDEIQAAVWAAISSPDVAQALSRPSLMHMLLLDMAKAGKRDQVIGALQRGASISSTTEAGETALILAAEAHSQPTVRVLLLARAEVDAYAPGKGTALHIAAACEDEATVLELLDFGASPTLTNHDGLNAIELMRADYMEECTRARLPPSCMDPLQGLSSHLLPPTDG